MLHRRASNAANTLFTRRWPVFLLACLLIGTLPTHGSAAPNAVQGVLDLSTWTPDTDGIIRLQGEWEFYWRAFIHPETFSAGEVPESPRFIRVPGAWEESRYGYATYRLRILHADAFGPLALHIPYEQSAYRLWINGKLMAANGEIGKDPETSQPEYRPVLIRYHPQPGEDEIELVIQVSNFDFRLGGLWNSPLFGQVHTLERLLDTRHLTTALLGGAFLVVAVYHFAFSIFRRRSTNASRATLSLAFLSLSIATRTLLMGERTLALLLPDLPWVWQIRLEYLTGYSAVLATALFLAATFPRETPRVVLWVATLSTVIGGGITLLTPVRIASIITPFVIVLDATLVLAFIGIGVLAFVRRREGGTLLLSGGLIFGTTAFLDFLYYNRVIESINLMPFGFLGLVFCQTLILGQQFASAFYMQGKLLHDLQHSRSLIVQLHEQERREVAEFLHSRVQNRLLLLHERLKEAVRFIEQHDPRARGAVQAVSDELLAVQEGEVRRASHLLHPSAIEAGLIPAVRSLAASYDGTLEVSVHADDAFCALDERSALGLPDARPALSRSLCICLYRIIQECLGNAQKHSGGRHIDIAFRLVESTLQLRITDDGRGFPSQPLSTRGLGLKIVDARVREAGGTWHITPNPTGGTIIQVTMPLDPLDYGPTPHEPTREIA